MKRILLIGAGHAHIVVLRHFAKHRPNAEMILVNDTEHAWYTGALPALIRGDIKPEQARLDLQKLTIRAGVVFKTARFERYCEERSDEAIHLPLKRPITAHFTNHEPIECDVLSLSIGGAKTVTGIKPIPEFLRRLAHWEISPNPKIGIIGSGAAGIEIALALRIRLGNKADIRIQSRDGTLLPTAPANAQHAAAKALQDTNIQIVQTLPEGAEIITAYTPEPSIEITETLALASRTGKIFATGDTAKFPRTLPRSGAIAVRQGWTLAYNLTSEHPKIFKIPAATLAILSLNSQQAIAWYSQFSWTGRLPMLLKNILDRRWVRN